MKALSTHIKDKKIDLSRFPKKDYDNPPAERAVLFSSPGGLMRTVERYLLAADAGRLSKLRDGL